MKNRWILIHKRIINKFNRMKTNKEILSIKIINRKDIRIKSQMYNTIQ